MRKLSEGDKLWGTLDVSPLNRSMWRRVRLTVYPPGTTSAERRALHFAHSWPVAGALLALAVTVMLSALSPIVVVAAVAAMYLAGFGFGAWLTRSVGKRIRSVSVVSMYIGGGLEEHGDADLLRAARARLESMDERRRSGELDPVRYEAEWAAVYEKLPGAVRLPVGPLGGPARS